MEGQGEEKEKRGSEGEDKGTRIRKRKKEM